MRSICGTLLMLGLLGFAAGCKREQPAPEPDPQPTAPDLNAVVVPKGDPEPVKPRPMPKKPFGKFTISEATTFVTGPVDDTGHIDYAAALNERLSKGVTPENNANVLIWKAIGPTPFGPKGTPPGMFDKLGMSPPAPDGNYFIRLSRYSGQPTTGTEELLTRLSQQPWKGPEHSIVADWLKANEKPLALVIEATKRSRYYSPIIPQRDEQGSKGLYSSLLPSVQSCRELALALTTRAMLAMTQGDKEAAWVDLIACHRLGRLCRHGGLVIEGLVGVAIEVVACRASLVFLEQAQSDAKQLESYIRDLQSLQAPPLVANQIDLGERFAFLDSLMTVNRVGFDAFSSIRSGPNIPTLPSPAVLNGIDWNPGLKAGNGWYDSLTEALREEDRIVRARRLRESEVGLFLFEQTFTQKSGNETFHDATAAPDIRGRVLGAFLLVGLAPAARKVQNAHERVDQLHANVLVAFALELHMWDNGKYPDSLTALSPKYLAEVPGDLFSGKPLIYKRDANSYRFYSVGINGTDDGGSDQPPADDIVVRVPSQPVKP
jgi:hypothetical protein